MKIEITGMREALCAKEGRPAKCIEITFRLEDGYEGFVSFFAEEIKDLDERTLMGKIKEKIKETLPKTRPIGKTLEI